MKNHIEKIPYLTSFINRFPPLTCAILEKLTHTHSLYQEQVLAKIITDYAKQHLGEEEFYRLKKHSEKYLPPVAELYPERQLATYTDCILKNSIDAILHLPTQTIEDKVAISLDNDPELHKTLRYLIARITQSYYVALDGFFPTYFEQVEGYYLDTISPTHRKTNNDASEGNERQLTLLIILKCNEAELRLITIDNSVSIQLTPGKIVVMPSNYSCMYEIIAHDEDVKLLKVFRCD